MKEISYKRGLYASKQRIELLKRIKQGQDLKGIYLGATGYDALQSALKGLIKAKIIEKKGNKYKILKTPEALQYIDKIGI